MTGGGLGGGVIFVVAALLWAAVLVPAWVRRREFRAAERNAIRLQRTLRVLAETTEVPQEVRLEATAKQALAHEKLLRTAQRRQAADREAELAEGRAEQLRAELRAQEVKRKEAAVHQVARLHRPVVRRVRGLALLATVVGLLGTLVGAGFAIAGSGSAILLWSAAILVAAIGGLVLLAPGRARVHSIAAERVDVRPAAQAVVQEEYVATGESSQASAAHAAAQRAASQRIERARAMTRARAQTPQAVAKENQTDSILLREARAAAQKPAAASPVVREIVPEAAPTVPVAPRVTVPRVSEQQHAARARLSQMGVIGDTSEGMPDLDAVLRRRRNVS